MVSGKAAILNMICCMFLGVVVTLIPFVVGYAIDAHSERVTLEEVNEELTCWTCPNKSANEECNDWAPDIQCPLNFTLCKTVHRLHVLSGETLLVNKMCTQPEDCTPESVGCHETSVTGVLECRSCCHTPYCNELVPVNMTTALMLSSFPESSFSSSTSSSLSWSPGRNVCLLILPAILLIHLLPDSIYSGDFTSHVTSPGRALWWMIVVLSIWLLRFLGDCEQTTDSVFQQVQSWTIYLLRTYLLMKVTVPGSDTDCFYSRTVCLLSLSLFCYSSNISKGLLYVLDWIHNICKETTFTKRLPWSLDDYQATSMRLSDL